MSKKVAIDIGHGSNTFPPSKGTYKNGKGYAEHDFNSKLGIEVEKLLKHNGFKTYMKQKPFSKDVSLTARTRYYNQMGMDLVWSIHANAGVSSANGICAFYWHTSTAGKKLAELFIDEVKRAGYSTHGNGLHASMKGSWTNLHIVRETKMVSVLTENGFMTNDTDFDLLFGKQQAKFINDMAKVHAKAICKFFGVTFKDFSTKPKTPTPASKPTASASTHKVVRGDTLWGIAKKYGMTVNELKALNKGVKLEPLQVGTVLHLKEQKKATPTYIGTVEVITSQLWYYNKADWNAKHGIAKKGEVFTVVQELIVGGSKMYKLKSGMYITANPKYVKFKKA